jgi:hypothetical protein
MFGGKPLSSPNAMRTYCVVNLLGTIPQMAARVMRGTAARACPRRQIGLCTSRTTLPRPFPLKRTELFCPERPTGGQAILGNDPLSPCHNSRCVNLS